jgi:hypothetical protein
MRVAFLIAVLSLLNFRHPIAHQTTSASPQAGQILQQALAALNGTTTTRDVTLTGSAHYIAGSDDEAGTATLKATDLGDSRIDLTLPSGNRSEVINLSAGLPAGQWSGTDGARHPIAFHNLLSEPAWFAPVTAISRRLSGSGFAATYVGAETLDSQNVHHISVTQPALLASASSSPSQTDLFTHLTQIDLYIDTTTFLPAAVSFNVHPDDNELLDIPIQIRYSDYRLVNGQQIPFHILKFLNNTLFLDIQLDSATVNTGLPSTTFGVS